MCRLRSMPDAAGVNERLARIMAAQLGMAPREVTPSLAAGGTERWDSLGHVQLMLRIEQAFGVRFTTRQFPLLTSVAKIEAALRHCGAL